MTGDASTPDGPDARTATEIRASPDLTATLANAEAALADLTEVGGDWAVVSGVNCVHLPAPYPWAVQAKMMTPPSAEVLASVLQWIRARSPAGGTVATRRAYAELPVFTEAGLEPAVVLGAMVLLAGAAERTDVAGLEIGEARSVAEFRTVFCSFGTDLAALITEQHLAAPSYRFFVGRFGGAPVGCAQVRVVDGTAHLSAVAVLPEFRGLGVGSAVSAAATRSAREWCSGPVWLHAEPHLQPLYHRLGYRWVDDHVQLRVGPADSWSRSALMSHG